MLAVSLFSPERTETDVWITSHDLDDRDENLHLLYSDVLPRSVGTCEGWVDEDNFPGIGVGQIADFVEDVDCEEEEEDLQRFDDAFLDVVGNSCQVGMRRRWVGFQSGCWRFLFIIAQDVRLFPVRFKGEDNENQEFKNNDKTSVFMRTNPPCWVFKAQLNNPPPKKKQNKKNRENNQISP